MKNVIFLLLLLLSNNSFCQEVFDEASMTLEAGKIIDQANARIVRSDTLIEFETKEIQGTELPSISHRWRTIKHYDSENRLVMKEQKTLNDPPTSVRRIPNLLIWDNHNNYILESINDDFGTTWLLALLKYNDKGDLLEKKFWNDVTIAKMVFDNPKKPHKYIIYNSNGEKVRSWRKAKRKVPYKWPE